jgi:hypothetical protein
MQEEASKASGVGVTSDDRRSSMPLAQRTGYKPADPRFVASPPPMPSSPPPNGWPEPQPARNATYPMLSHPPQSAPPVPLAPGSRPLDYQHQQPQSGHGRTVSSSSMPAMHHPGQPIQPQLSRPPSSQASSGTGGSHGNGGIPSRRPDLPVSTPHHQRPASASHQDVRPLNPAQSRIAADQDTRAQHRKSYALQDPGAMPRPTSYQPGDTHPNPSPAGSRRDSELMPPGRVQGNGYKGADTFEQMGFVSKPVSGDNDCRIM